MTQIQAKSVKLVPIDEIAPNPKNRNKHSPEQIERLADIIKYQGFRAPLIVSNRTGLLVAGHGRLMAAKKLGLKQVPVMHQDFESDEQEYAAQVSDNAIASWAELDLSGINTDLSDLGPDLNIDLLGIRGFSLDPSERIEEINRGDENAAWVEMPEFKPGENYIKLTYIFGSAESRDNFIKEQGIAVDLKKNDNNWICYR